MEKIDISYIIGTSQTKALQECSTFLDRMLITYLKNNQGDFSIPKFKKNDLCWDIITYNHAIPCVIEDTWEENGWNKYLVTSARHCRIIRECDLISRKEVK